MDPENKDESPEETFRHTRDVLERARKWVEEQRPGVSAHKAAAFANSVQSMVTGWSGGYGGPSVREHAASWLYGGRRMSYEEAIALLNKDDGPIFGPITDLHRQVWENEYCFDDDPEDVAELRSSTGIGPDETL